MSKEPVAWRTYRVVTDDWKYHDFPYKLDLTCQPLYTRKRPLSDEEIYNLWKFRAADFTELVRAIEKAHGIGDSDE